MGTGFQYTGDKDLSGWIDKSQFLSHASCETGLSTSTTLKWQPYGFNGKPCFTFPGRLNGAGRYFGAQFQNSGVITTNTIHVFIVASQQSTIIGGGTDSEFCCRFIGFGNGANTDDFNNTNCFGFLRQSDTGCGPYRANQYVANNPATYDYPTLWQAWFDGSTVARTTFLDGDNTTTRTGGGTTASFAIGYYKVGCNNNYTDLPSYLTGKISEILVYGNVLTATQISQIQGYLAWKYNLQDKLPSGHTYKSAPPP